MEGYLHPAAAVFGKRYSDPVILPVLNLYVLLRGIAAFRDLCLIMTVIQQRNIDIGVFSRLESERYLLAIL